MRILKGEEEKKGFEYIEQAVGVAKYAKCLRSKCGAVIVKDDKIIGKGYNAPPGDKTLESCIKDSLPENFKSDKTCCVHAEQRALMQALKTNPDKVKGSRLYFIRLDEKDEGIPAGEPYCTICSKLVLDSEISEFVLWHKEGLCVYNTEEYNDKSFEYRI